MYDFLHEWAVENEPEKAAIWFADREKMLAVLRLYMGIGMKRRRKDFIYARQIMELIGYFFGTSESEEKDGFKLDAQLTRMFLKNILRHIHMKPIIRLGLIILR